MGGTHSIVQAFITFVMEKRKQGVKDPVLLVAESTHYAFDKAGELCNARLIKVPCDPVTRALSLVELKKHINWYGAHNIAGIGASAPNFPTGIMDDIQGVSKIA